MLTHSGILGGARAPTVSGTPKVGQTLTASAVSVWNVGGSARSFLSPSTTYVPVPGDVGKTATATAGGKTSNPTASVVDADLPTVSPPLSYGARVAILGDSIVQQNAQGVARGGDATQGGVNSRATGELTQYLSLNPNINAINWYDQSKTTTGTNRLSNGSDQGINGQISTTIAARVSDITALAPDVCVINMGTNNTTQASTVLSDISSTVSTLRTAGIRVILGTIRPNTAANESVNRAKADIQSINASIRSYITGLADSGVVLWDAYKQYDQGDGYMAPLNTYDRLLHPNEMGAELGAWGNDTTNPSPYSLAGALRQLIGSGNVYTDIMTANANLFTNPTLTGTTGSLGTNFTGQAPTSWRWEPQSTVVSSVACSVISNPSTGGQSAVATITPAGTAAYERFNFRISAFTQNVASLSGKWVRIFFEIETDGTPWLMAPESIIVAMETATVTQSSYGFAATLVPGTGNFISPLSPIGRRRQIMSEPLLCGPSATGLQPSVMFIFIPNGATGVAVVKVHRAWMATVPNPKTVWNN